MHIANEVQLKAAADEFDRARKELLRASLRMALLAPDLFQLEADGTANAMRSIAAVVRQQKSRQ
ncbi:hypothetical protein [Neoroseomonas lacus]|uniref:Uncharacterized protein n=1 Tax=Neoroseomonas lacus TaxID=287609 RepID=A0A917NRU8_9PROT|nr:hypothetical protein [Neoroseomonas lacus]GGJ22637.1 hypothetical protein GCM10011320_32320 [Neoroseomonas lacus]